jgi:hypothetical protein
MLSLALILLLTFPMLSIFKIKQQVMLACSLRVCGYLNIQDPFDVYMIVEPSLLAWTSNKYFNVLELKMYQPAYAIPNPMWFANGFINPWEMLFMYF